MLSNKTDVPVVPIMIEITFSLLVALGSFS